jgi:hypothetical protein
VSAAMQIFLGVWKKANLDRSCYENRTCCTVWLVDLGLGVFPTASIAGIEQRRTRAALSPQRHSIRTKTVPMKSRTDCYGRTEDASR